MRVQELNIISSYTLAKWCYELQQKGLLFHFDDMNEVVPSLFTVKKTEAIFRTVHAAFQTLSDPHAFGVLALHAHAALNEEEGSEEQILNENAFFDDLSDIGVDVEASLADYCLKATLEERIVAGFEELRKLPL